MAGDNNGFQFPNPEDLPDGIDTDTLRLASTISGRIYQDPSTTNSTSFQNDLRGILDANNNKFPNLEVQFLYKQTHVLGNEFINNMPVFTAIITDNKNPDTLILGWRGTSNRPMDLLRDVFATTPVDINGYPRAGNNDGVFIQKAVFEVLKAQFRVSTNGGKGKDLIKLVTTGNKVPKKEGGKIKKIIFTGHSLGGMLAQGAHYILQNGLNSPLFGEVSEAIQACEVKLYTLAFSGVMSLSSTNQAFRIDNMINISYGEDVLTRCYGNTEYMHAFLNIFAANLPTVEQGQDMVANMVGFFLDSRTPIFETYKHAGTIIHYPSKNAAPIIYTNETFLSETVPATQTITLDMWFRQFHSGTVSNRNELGLSWW